MSDPEANKHISSALKMFNTYRSKFKYVYDGVAEL